MRVWRFIYSRCRVVFETGARGLKILKIKFKF